MNNTLASDFMGCKYCSLLCTTQVWMDGVISCYFTDTYWWISWNHCLHHNHNWNVCRMQFCM